jgi:hypothetical protein
MHLVANYDLFWPFLFPTATRSFILEICSHLRLSSELVPTASLLHTYLSGSRQFAGFVPELRAQCELQAKGAVIYTPVDPVQRALSQLRGQMATPLPSDKPPEGFTTGIELGSVC